MGTVYLGEDTRTGERVAIKQLKPEIVRGGEEFVERFTREADALRVLNHPNIVKVFALVQEEDVHYMVMEYVGGGALDEALEETPQLPVERVLEIALDLADALTRAHRLKIIHRDIKPGNVLLAEDGTPRLTDFGVAHMDTRTRVTQTGAIIGTMNYLSPEALEGQVIDERSDIWAFGVMLFEMLAGRRPFDESNTSALITAILTKEIPDLRAIRPDAPESLVLLIESMLVKDRSSQIDSVRKVGAEVENIIRGVDSVETDLKQAVAEPEKSRFATITPETPLQVEASKHHGVSTIKTDEGQEFFVIPHRMITVMRVVVILLFLTVAGLVIVLATRSPQPAASAAQIAPVADDEYMILVAKPEHLGGAERDVQRFIVEDLKQRLETGIPFSNLRVRAYDGILTTADDARQVAKTTGASIVVWGHYDEAGIDLKVDIGSLAKFPHNVFIDPAADTAAIGGTEVTLSDERRESTAPYIVGVMAFLHVMDSNLFEVMRALAILDVLKDASVPLSDEQGNANQFYTTYFATYLTDTEAAVRAMDGAIALNGADPFAYVFRAMAELRLGREGEVLRDVESARRLAPPGWIMPIEIRASIMDNPAEVHDALLAITEARPDDWFMLTSLSLYYYSVGDLDGAWETIQQSIAANPQANYPYVFGFLTAMHTGRVKDAARMVAAIARDHPDPSFGNRVFAATFGPDNLQTAAGGLLFESFGNLLLGQDKQVVESFDQLVSQLLPQILARLDAMTARGQGSDLSADPSYIMSDFYTIQGLAYCGLGNLDAALNAYNTGLAFRSDYHLLYLLRAGVYHEQGVMEKAQADIEKARGLSAEFDAFVDDAISGKVSCGNFFDYFVALANEE